MVFQSSSWSMRGSLSMAVELYPLIMISMMVLRELASVPSSPSTIFASLSFGSSSPSSTKCCYS